MTIQLKSPIFISGTHQDVGTLLTLGAAQEAELVNRGVAVYTARMVTPGEGNTPVTTIRDAFGNVVSLIAQEKRVGSVCLLHYENAGGFVAPPGSAEQIISSVVLIPANTLIPGDKLRFVLNSEDAGTADAQLRTVRIRIHSTQEILSGQVFVTGSISTASNTKFTIDKCVSIVSETTLRSSSSTVAGGAISTAATLLSTINCAVDQYIGLTIQNANTLVNHLVYYANLSLE